MVVPPELLAPAAEVTLRIVLISLLSLLGWAVVVGLCAAIVGVVDAILWPLRYITHRIPFAHHVLDGIEHNVQQAMTNLLWSSVAQLDAQAGKFWHGLKQLSVNTAEEIAGLAIITGYTAWILATKLNPLIIGKKLHHALVTAHHAEVVAGHAVGRVIAGEKEARHAAHPPITLAPPGSITIVTPKVSTVQGRTAAPTHTTIPIPAPTTHPLPARVGGVAHTHVGVLSPGIEGLRERTKALEDSAVRVFHRIKGVWVVPAVGVVAAAVAVALPRLGLDWARCRNVKRVGRSICGLSPKGLESILGLLTDLLVLSSICEVIPLLESAFGTIAAPIIGLLTEAGAGLCSPTASPPATLSVPDLSLPASSGVTLYL
jgi:hypothetical protein